MQILPSKELTPFIRHYLFLDSAGKGNKKLRLFSDGSMGMVFSFKSPLIATMENNEALQSLPASFVYGQINDFKDLYLSNEAALLIVVFHPAGIHHLLGIPANTLKNQIIQAQELFGAAGLQLRDQLFEQKRIHEQVNLLNHFFAGIAAKKVLAKQVLIDASVNFILKNKGINTVHSLVKYTGYTERHLERIFMESIGLTPRQFGNIVKLHGFLKLLKTWSKENNLTRISYEAGYGDQAHGIKQFRKYTGITPKEYLNNSKMLTINFMELNTGHSLIKPMSGLYNLPG